MTHEEALEVNVLLNELSEVKAERDRLRGVLEKIAAMPLSTSWQHHFYDAVKLAQDALQEAGDE